MANPRASFTLEYFICSTSIFVVKEKFLIPINYSHAFSLLADEFIAPMIGVPRTGDNSFFGESLTWFAVPIALVDSLVFTAAEFMDKVVSHEQFARVYFQQLQCWHMSSASEFSQAFSLKNFGGSCLIH
jgi:hypothetical protein